MKIGKLIGYDETTQRMDGDILFSDVPYKIFKTTVDDVNYEDISTMEAWDKSNLLDWYRRRTEISTLFYAEAGAGLETFAGMSTERKLLSCKYFLIPYATRMLLITDDEDEAAWDLLLHEAADSRDKCIEAMRIKTGQYMRIGTLTLTETQEFFKDVSHMIEWYVKSNSPDFKQWLTNEVGSAYENAGFADATYYISQVKDDLVDIYNGSY